MRRSIFASISSKHSFASHNNSILYALTGCCSRHIHNKQYYHQQREGRHLRALPSPKCSNLFIGNISSCRHLHNVSFAEEGVIHSEFPPVPVATKPVHETLLDAIWRHSLEQPGRAAFISAECPNDRITFAEFFLQSHSVSDFLASVGFVKGDVAGVAVHNCFHFLAMFLGACMRGGCISGANPQLTDVELAYQFNEAKCRVAFCSNFLLDKMLSVMQKCPSMKHLVLIPSQFPASSIPNLPPSIHNWAEIVQFRPGIERQSQEIDVSRDLAYLPFSSGTTGRPKGVMLSHRNLGTILNIFNNHFDKFVVERLDPRWEWRREHALLLLPLYHIYGFVLGLNSLMTGGTGVMLKKFDLEQFCRTVQEYKLKYATLVPPILVLLAKNDSVVSRFDLSSLRFVMSGAAPTADDICEALKRRIPSIAHIGQGYGMTEQSMCSHLPVFGMDNQRAAGRLNPNFEMKIVDVEKRTPVRVGELGEICTRSPTIMLGYLNRPEETIQTIDENGWMKTGDIGYHDEQGWTYVVDRLKELIKVKGLQVAPAELESHLLAHPSIKDCAVVGVPDELCGEVVKAFVVRTDDEKLTEVEVKQFLHGKVATYKQLRHVEFVDAIPKSPSGKILRRLLRDKHKP